MSKMPTIDSTYETGAKKAQKSVSATRTALFNLWALMKYQSSERPSIRKIPRSTSMRFRESIR